MVLTFPRKAGNEWWYFKEATVSKRMATEETCLVNFLGFSLDGCNFWLTGRSINYNHYLLVPRQGWKLCLISYMSQATANAQSWIKAFQLSDDNVIVFLIIRKDGAINAQSLLTHSCVNFHTVNVTLQGWPTASSAVTAFTIYAAARHAFCWSLSVWPYL